MLGDLLSGHSCVFCCCFASAGRGVGHYTSAHREESLNHTSRVLGKYAVLDLFLFIMLITYDYAWI